MYINLYLAYYVILSSLVYLSLALLLSLALSLCQWSAAGGNTTTGGSWIATIAQYYSRLGYYAKSADFKKRPGAEE